MLLTTSVLLAQIRKPPDIAKTHAVPDNTKEELHFPTPRRPVLLLRLLAAGDILTSCCYDRHVMGGLATVVQRCQLVPISRRTFDYHSPVDLDGHKESITLLLADDVSNWDPRHALLVCLLS